MNNYKVTVLGGGSFGTAISNIIASNGYATHLWMRDVERASRCQKHRENPEYLPGYALSDNLIVTSSIDSCVKESDVVVISVPSQSFREVSRQVAPALKKGAIVVSTTKGIEAESFQLMSQIVEQECITAENGVRVGVLSGPNFAKEIIQGQFTGSVIASEDERVVETVQNMFSSKTFRIYSNTDRYGVELGGALKNIYAIITGMATALGCGSNTMAMLLTRSLAEMGRFARKMGADSMTFLGLAGVGDLVLTCTSNLSRNFRVGHAIGQGKTLDQAVKDIGQVAEGVNTLRIVKHKADEIGVYMPLVQGLYQVIFEDKNITAIVEGLMTGEMSSDVDLRGGM